MKRKNLELLVLILGIAIICVALFFMLARDKTAQTIFVTNLVFAVGFLIYILYSMMTTNSLNGEIRRLNQQIMSLKEEIRNKENTIIEKDTRINQLNQDKQNLEQQLTSSRNQFQEQEIKVRDLEAKIQELEASKENKQGE